MKQVYSFVFGASDIKLLPDESVPEVTFAGRSNVGKSSLINALTNSKKSARVSSKPGCTRQINFYSTFNNNIRLVDLPGYGYSYASKKEIIKYLNLVKYYLLKRNNLKKVFTLIDGRIGLKEIDRNFICWLSANYINFNVILTKIDKMSYEDSQIIKENTKKWINNNNILVYEVSTHTNLGIKNIRNEIYSII